MTTDMTDGKAMALDKNETAQIEVREGVDRETVETVQNMGAYKYGWETEIEMEYAPLGVNEDIVRLISEKNGEPEWMTDWRLKAFARWKEMEEPRWAMLDYPRIDYQSQYYYAKPKSMTEKPKSLDEVDPKLLATYEKLGIPLKEQMILAGVEGAEEAPADARRVAVDTTKAADRPLSGVARRAARASRSIPGGARLAPRAVPIDRRVRPPPPSAPTARPVVGADNALEENEPLPRRRS